MSREGANCCSHEKNEGVSCMPASTAMGNSVRRSPETSPEAGEGATRVFSSLSPPVMLRQT